MQERREEPRDAVHGTARRRTPPARLGAPLQQQRLDASRSPRAASAAPTALRAGRAGSGDDLDAGVLEARRPAPAARRGRPGRSPAPPGRRARAPSRAAGGPTSRRRSARGWRRGPSTSRAVRRGSSASAVPMPHGHGVVVGPPAVHQGARLGAGDPAALARRRGDLAVEARRELQGHVRAAGERPGEEGGVELGARVGRRRRRRPRPRSRRRRSTSRPARGPARADRRSR